MAIKLVPFSEVVGTHLESYYEDSYGVELLFLTSEADPGKVRCWLISESFQPSSYLTAVLIVNYWV